MQMLVSTKIKSMSLLLSGATTNNKDSTMWYYPSIKNGLRIHSSNTSSSSNNDLISILDQFCVSNHMMFAISSATTTTNEIFVT